MMKNFDLISIVLKWKVTLAIILGLSIVLSTIFSSKYFITPKYRSTTIIYPSNLTPYSQESPTEQMLQLFQSDSIFNHVVKHFNLISHYKLDSSSLTIQNELLYLYNENVSIKKTEYEAVRIDVMDRDPQVACDMIKEMVNVFNAYTLKINKEKSQELADIFGEQLNRKGRQIDSINTVMKEIAVKFGIIDYTAQSRELSKEYYRTIATGNEKKINELTISLRNLEERGGKFHELQNHLMHSTTEYATLQTQYNTALSDTKKNLTYTNVVVKPHPSNKKVYPVRWLIVTISTFASILLALLAIMIIEGRKENI